MSKNDMEQFYRQSPGRRLGMLHRLSMAYMTRPLSELGITKGQIGFLMTVLQSEGIVQEELTHSMFIDRAATARALQSLENAGLIRREEDPEDRRRKRVYPTKKAYALRPGLLDMLARHNQALFAGLSPAEQDQCLDMLDRLVGNLRTAVEEVAR